MWLNHLSNDLDDMYISTCTKNGATSMEGNLIGVTIRKWYNIMESRGGGGGSELII